MATIDQTLEEIRIHHQLKYTNCLRERIKLSQLAEQSSDIRVLIRRKCALDVKWFCNTWITTYNPRIKPNSLLPFVMYPRQEEMIDFIEYCYQNDKWGAIVKCRYTGASYITTMWMLHKLLFTRDFTGTLASNKADAVDKTNNSKSLFYKILDMYKRLPPFLQPFEMKFAKTRMQIYNKQMNSAIVGESGSEIGRGGRSSAALVDEAAHIEADEAMVAALSENTDCAIFISTPKGVANQFFRLSNSSEVENFYYRWQADPRRSEEWRNKQTIKLGNSIAKQELDCDFYASTGESFIDPMWVEAAIDSHLKIPGMEGSPRDVQAGLDVAGAGKNDTILAIRKGSIIQPLQIINIDSVTQATLEVDRKIRQEIRPKVQVLCFDADGIGNDVRGVLLNMDEFPEYEIVKFHGAAKPSEKYWESHEQVSSEFLYNKRAEGWFILRERLMNTYNHLNGLTKCTPDQMISIPNDEGLRQDLLKPSWEYRSGKMLLQSKQDMRKKGLSSPDKADAVVYACYQDATAGWL